MSIKKTSIKKILFRADGNSNTGLGHLYRTFALIEMLKNDFTYCLYVKSSSTLSVIPHGYNVELMPDDIKVIDEPRWLAGQFGSENAILVADGYQFTSAYQKAVKDQGFEMFYIDDLTTEYMYADVVINHSPYVKESDFKAEPYTRFALGTKYAILRPLFLEGAKRGRKIDCLDTAFVCFGGADIFDLSLKTVLALLEIPEFKEINVVLGAAYNHTELLALAKKNSSLKVYRELDEESLFLVMSKCNFAVVPSSTILFEVCSVRMPVLSGYYVENQKNIYKSSVKNQIIFSAGNFNELSPSDIKDLVINILKKDFSIQISQQKLIFDNSIRERIVNLFRPLLFRVFDQGDCELLFGWTNNDLVRKNSYNSDYIDWADHVAWFNSILAKPDSIIYIAEVDGKPAGYVRFENKQETIIISIFIDDVYRGMGFSQRFIRECTQRYQRDFGNKTITAYIKQNNKPSLNAFKKAGYRKSAIVQVQGEDSYKYISN